MIIGIIGYSGAGKDTVANMIQLYSLQKKYGLQKSLFDEIFKDYIINKSNAMQNKFDWQIKKYAYKLKQICALLVGCKPEDFESEEFKNSPLPDSFQNISKHEFLNNPDWATSEKRTYRWFLQTVGMKMREVNENIWVDSLMVDYKENFTGNIIKAAINRKTEEKDWNLPNWIITDVRFENELKAIKDRKGTILRVDRPSLDLTQDKYKHESENKFQSFDYDYLLTNRSTFDNLYTQLRYALKHTGF